MLVLGFNGTYFRADEDTVFPFFVAHDASAVLLEDGEVIAGLEEERPTRIKHSAKAPFHAIAHCLTERGIRLDDLDRLAFYLSEDVPDDPASFLIMSRGRGLRTLLSTALERHFGTRLDPDRLCFVPHHTAHATSAFAGSGLEESLVVTFDGNGERLCGVAARGTPRGVEILRAYETGDWRHDSRSLGYYYWLGTRILGYAYQDEYKVMGLAPYGDPARFRRAIQATYELRPDGDYVLHLHRFAELARLTGVRQRGEPFTQVHKDLAASLQEGFEAVAFHVIRHFQVATGLRTLCLAGGCAHNSTMTGKLLYTGWFDEVFVQPAASDAGCALGAAYHVDAALRAPVGRRRALDHVFWGTGIDDDSIARELDAWRALVAFERVADVVGETAQLLAGGAAIGWVQGRSEFGPRALGNRSILADPRPAENRHVINALVKKREGYRPFAPAIPEDRLHDYFDVPAHVTRLPFMTFVVKVRPDCQSLLGAVTHVDGTARVQTVSAGQNERFWRLLRAFGRLTGVPILLNTSFNNNAEPIVDSVEDAVVCFLTTGLQHLIIGDYMIRKKPVDLASVVLGLVPSLPSHVRIRYVKRHTVDGWIDTYGLASASDPGFERPLTKEAYELLLRVDGRADVATLVEHDHAGDARCVADVLDLWHERLIVLRPHANAHG